MFNAVVLAGGIRSGLEVPGSGLPRALWPFPQQPLIAQVLGFLAKAGCDKVAVCANGKSRLIASQLRDDARYGGLHYSEDPLPRGPAGCLRDLAGWLGEETFVAIQATGAYDFSVEALVEEHRRTGAAVTVGARAAGDGLLEPVGVYLVEPKALALIPAVGYQDFKEQFLPKVSAAGMSVRGHVIRGEATLIHSVQHYLGAVPGAILRAAEALPKGFLLRAPGVVIHETARVHDSVKMTGGVWIDAEAVVEEGARLSEVIVGGNALVGREADVCRSVLLRDSLLPAFAHRLHAIVPPHPARAVRAAREALKRSRPISQNPVRRVLSALVGVGR